MEKRFFLLTLGCAKNQVDSRGIAARLTAAGWRRQEEAEGAGLLICNTCGFITSAKEESIDSILALAAVKAAHPGSRLVVCGCFPQRNGAELAAELPEVDLFLGTDAADTILAALDTRGLAVNPAGTDYDPAVGYDLLPGGKSAYLKIAEGCDNRCAYCAIPLIRGQFRTRPAAAILAEAALLAHEHGVLELNLISQDTSLWHDPGNPAYRLPELLADLEQVPGLEWIRALYLHPAHIDDALIRALGRGGKILPYFDIPVQHLADPVLARMGRRTTWENIRSLVTRIRENVPAAVLRTTCITGFPGETDADFMLLLKRIREIGFDKLGAFRYSQEEGTPAALMPDTVNKKTAAARYRKLMLLQRRISAKRLARHIGSVLPVLIEERLAAADGEAGTLYIGRSPHDAPDVDGAVVVHTGRTEDLTGRIVPVRIGKSSDYDLYGETE